MNTLLYGKDPEEFLVGVSAAGDEHVWLYSRNPDEPDVTQRKERVYPMIWCTPESLEVVRTAVGAKFKVQTLTGKNELNQLVVFDSLPPFRQAKKALRDSSTSFYVVSNPVDVYLHQTGKTMFKGMTPASVVRMQIDIETYRRDGFPDAEVDPIVIITMSDNTGWKQVLYWRDPWAVPISGEPDPHWTAFESEADMLTEMVKWMHRRDPDVIEGHNIFAYDLPYMETRCRLNDVYFGLGRDGKTPFSYPAEKKFAERDFTYQNYLIPGRTVIDTMFLAIDWDVFARKLTGVSLKEVARTLNVAPDDRVYIDGDQIAKVWDEEPERLLKYADHDTMETLGVSNQLIGSIFALTQMMPLNFQKVHLSGKASVIQSLFVREYLRQRVALPIPEPGQQEHGGYTDIFQTGLFHDVWYADVASLYPSIMLNYNIRPHRDELDLFQSILRQLTELRLETKGAMKTAKGARKEELDARQAAFKTIINSFYGMLGAGQKALFSTTAEADRVASTGQGLLKLMMEFIVEEGGDIIEVDTDGILFVKPADKDFAKDGPAFCSHITGLMPKGIDIDFDGAYKSMLSYKKKNYALLDPEGKIKVKGGSFKSRGLEPLFREYIQTQLETLLKGDVSAIYYSHEEAKKKLVAGVPPETLAKTATLKESLAKYERTVADGGNRAAQYEIALAMRREGRRVGKGDRIPYVVCGNTKPYKVRAFAEAEHLERVTPGMENKAFYLKRLEIVARGRFGFLFDDDDLKVMFSSKIVDPAQVTLFGDATEAVAEKINSITIKNKRLKDVPKN